MTDWNLPELLNAAGDSVGRQLRMVGEPLGGSSRSVVFRAAPVREEGSAVLVKVFDPGSAGEGWVRELSALRTLVGTEVLVPRYLAHADRPSLIVMSDLGGGRSLADSLLADGPGNAVADLHGWATALGRLHVTSASLGTTFADELARWGGGLPVDLDTTTAMLADIVDAMPNLLAGAGLTPTSAELAELASLRMTTSALALTPDDACPDNNLRVGDDLALIDFEGATFRHIAWDAAYLAVPWPSCWCAWRMDDQVVADAMRTWKSVVESTFPAVTSAEFDRDLGTAVAAYAFLAVRWYLAGALDGDPVTADPSRAAKMPMRRPMLHHRLGRVAEYAPHLPALGGLAERLLHRLRELWGPTPLMLAPAFRT